jgi:hypothetical protein
VTTKSIVQPEIEVAGKQAVEFRDRPAAGLQASSKAHHPLCFTYWGAVVTVGALVLIYSAYRALVGSAELGWLAFALLTCITAAFSLKIPKSDLRVSVPDVFIFSSILLFGPAIGALTAAMEGLMGSLRAKTRSRRFRFAAFNMTAVSFSAFAAGKIYEYLSFHIAGNIAREESFQPLVSSLAILALCYFVLNTGLLALMISLDKRIHAIQVWVQFFSWMGVGYLAAALMAGILFITAQAISPITLALLLIVPVATYVAYRHVLRIMSENIGLKENVKV